MVLPMSAKTLQILAACAALGASAAAWAADPPPDVVDTGVGDRHATSAQLRIMPVDLSPHGFERTYRVPGRNDLLMRTNGALYAVFDNMEYERDKRFKYQKVFKAVIPAATIFYIGRPDFKVIPSTGIRAVNLRRDDNPPEPAPSSALESFHGVGHVREFEIGPSLEVGPKQRVDDRVRGEHPKEVRQVNEDISYPVSRPRIKPSSNQAATPTSRAERPNLSGRIDDLMRRASKDS